MKQNSKPRTRRRTRTRSKFINIDIQHKFTLTITKQDLDQLVSRAIEEGIGDWGIITAATRAGPKGFRGLTHLNITHTLPIQVVDIETNRQYTIDRAKMLRAIRDSLIDFPYALDTRAGYNLAVNKLTREDIDEIVQVAVFKEIQYGFV